MVTLAIDEDQHAHKQCIHGTMQMYIVQCTLYTYNVCVQCTMYVIHCATLCVYNVHCTYELWHYAYCNVYVTNLCKVKTSMLAGIPGTMPCLHIRRDNVLSPVVTHIRVCFVCKRVIPVS